VGVDLHGATGFYQHYEEPDTKHDMLARFRQAETILESIRSLSSFVSMVALEDYDLNPTQHVGYQIAEVAALVKYKLLEWHMPLLLIHPMKRSSWIIRKRLTSKEVKRLGIQKAVEGGFTILGEKKAPGGEGLYQRQKEDLGDAWCLAQMGRHAHLLLSEGALTPVTGDLFLDPKTGLLFNTGVLFNDPHQEELSLERH
jgi:hypothetical protein